MKHFVTLLLLLVIVNECVGSNVVNIGMRHSTLHPSQIPPHYRSHIKSLLPNIDRISQTNVVDNQTISGNIKPQGIYWTQIGLGTPPQLFNIAVDTGSTDLLVPEQGCNGCHLNVTGIYDPTKSSTMVPVDCNNRSYSCEQCINREYCGFEATYETCNLTDPTQPCSVKCQLIDDQLAMGTQSGVDTVFGVIYYQTKNFQQFFYIDGVLGFIGNGASSFGGISAFQRMVDEGKYQNIFAMCLNPYHGGVLTLGGTDPNLQTGDFMYTPLTFGLGYSVVMEQILVNGNSIGLSGSHSIIVDSGTNVLLQPEDHYVALYKYFQSTLCPSFPVDGVCGSQNLFTGQCYQYTQSEISQFPNISLQLKGATLTVSGSQYLVTSGNSSTEYCLGITSTGVGGLSIIGDVIMQAYYTVFDNENNRLGWAPVNSQNCFSESLSAQNFL